MATIVETTSSAIIFNTLSAAVKAAEFETVLSGPGPFTVFAPTDEAFAMIPEWAVRRLFRPESKAQLVDILMYHVLPGKVMAAEVSQMRRVKTMQGQSIRIDLTSGIRVDGARIVKADITCDNGVIHIIDKVIPPQ